MYTLITGTTNRNYIDVEWQKQKNLAMVNMMAVMQLSYMFKKMKVDTAKEVAEKSYKAMMKNKAVYVVGFHNKLIAFATRFGSLKLNRKIAKKINIETAK